MHGFRRVVAGDVARSTGNLKLAMEYIGDTDIRRAREYIQVRPDRRRGDALQLRPPFAPGDDVTAPLAFPALQPVTCAASATPM